MHGLFTHTANLLHLGKAVKNQKLFKWFIFTNLPMYMQHVVF